MASDMISRKALVKAILAERDKIPLTVPAAIYEFVREKPNSHGNAMRGGIRKALHCVETAPAVDAIPIDTVAEMLADLFGDCCPCNYNDLDEVLSIGCERKNCPGFFEDDYSCWKKYVKVWMERNGKDAHV